MTPTARTSKQAEISPADAGGTHSLVLSHIPFALAILTAAVGALFAGQYTWGFDFWSLFPIWILGFAILAYLAVSYVPVSDSLIRVGEHVVQGTSRLPSSLRMIIVGAIGFVSFLLLRSQTMLYGDGWMWVSISSVSGFENLFDVYGRLRPLTFLLYRFGNYVFADGIGASDQLAFSIVSALGGVAGLLGLYRLAGALAPSGAARLFLLLCALTSGATVLFFGYVESYVWSTAALIWFMYFGIRKGNGSNSWSGVIISGAIMCAFSVVLSPVFVAVLGLLVTQRNDSEGNTRYLLGWSFGRLAVIAVVAAMVLVALSRAVGPEAVDFVLSPTPAAPYWAFGVSHLADMANQILLVAPLLTGLVCFWIIKGRSRQIIPPALHVVITAALVTFVFSFWIDPVLGAPRDWDLLSSFGFPASIAIGCLLLQFQSERVTRLMLVPAALLVMVLLLPNVLEKANATKATERLDTLLWNDAHYQGNYQDAYNCFHWSYQLHTIVKRDDLAKRYVSRRVEAAKTDDRAWHMLGEILMAEGSAAPAEAAFRRAWTLKPDNESYRLGLVWALQKQGRGNEAETLLAQIPEDKPGSVYEHRSRGIALAEQGRLQEALAAFRTADAMQPNSLPEKANLGLVFSLLQQPDSALAYLSSALPLVDAETECGVREAMVGQYIAARRTMEAIEAFREFEKKCPKESANSALRQQISTLARD